jgi:hypothetical protein
VSEVRPDGLQARCRECSRAWYAANRDKHIANVRRRNTRYVAELRERMREHFLANPCVDCGETDIRCLEFDHLDPGSKTANVANMLGGALSWKTISAEIAKCVVRCANCHRRRTGEMIGSWRSKAFLIDCEENLG